MSGLPSNMCVCVAFAVSRVSMSPARSWSLHPLAAVGSAPTRIVATWIDEALVGGLGIRSCGLGGQQVCFSCFGVLALCADRFLACSGLQRFGSQPFRRLSRWIQRIRRRVPALDRCARCRSGWYRHVVLLECNATLDTLRLLPYAIILPPNTVCRPLVHAKCLNILSKGDFRLHESKRCFDFVPNR